MSSFIVCIGLVHALLCTAQQPLVLTPQPLITASGPTGSAGLISGLPQYDDGGCGCSPCPCAVPSPMARIVNTGQVEVQDTSPTGPEISGSQGAEIINTGVVELQDSAQGPEIHDNAQGPEIRDQQGPEIRDQQGPEIRDNAQGPEIRDNAQGPEIRDQQGPEIHDSAQGPEIKGDASPEIKDASSTPEIAGEDVVNLNGEPAGFTDTDSCGCDTCPCSHTHCGCDACPCTQTGCGCHACPCPAYFSAHPVQHITEPLHEPQQQQDDQHGLHEATVRAEEEDVEKALADLAQHFDTEADAAAAATDDHNAQAAASSLGHVRHLKATAMNLLGEAEGLIQRIEAKHGLSALKDIETQANRDVEAARKIQQQAEQAETKLKQTAYARYAVSRNPPSVALCAHPDCPRGEQACWRADCPPHLVVQAEAQRLQQEESQLEASVQSIMSDTTDVQAQAQAAMALKEVQQVLKKIDDNLAQAQAVGADDVLQSEADTQARAQATVQQLTSMAAQSAQENVDALLNAATTDLKGARTRLDSAEAKVTDFPVEAHDEAQGVEDTAQAIKLAAQSVSDGASTELESSAAHSIESQAESLVVEAESVEHLAQSIDMHGPSGSDGGSDELTLSSSSSSSSSQDLPHSASKPSNGAAAAIEGIRRDERHIAAEQRSTGKKIRQAEVELFSHKNPADAVAQATVARSEIDHVKKEIDDELQVAAQTQQQLGADVTLVKRMLETDSKQADLHLKRATHIEKVASKWLNKAGGSYASQETTDKLTAAAREESKAEKALGEAQEALAQGDDITAAEKAKSASNAAETALEVATEEEAQAESPDEKAEAQQIEQKATATAHAAADVEQSILSRVVGKVGNKFKGFINNLMGA